MNHSDDILMAYADGELASDDAAKLAKEIAADPVLAARVAAFSASRRQAMEAFPLEPVSADLVARIRSIGAEARRQEETPSLGSAGQNIVRLDDRRKVPIWQLPAAAAVALAVGLSFGLLRDPGASPNGLQMAIFDTDGLAQELDRLPQGERTELSDGQFVVIASFRNGDGELCREFEYDSVDDRSVVSVACRTAASWDVRFAVATPTAVDGYAPASSLEALDAWLASVDASAPLDPDQERDALGLGD